MLSRRLATLALLVALPILSTASLAHATAPPQPDQYPPYTPPPSGATPPPPPYGAPPPPYGAPAAPPSAPAPEKHLGVGYKIGNGLGFAGADVIVAPIPHLALDLQANYESASTDSGTATGYGIAPGVQGRLFTGQTSTPYLGIGLIHIKLSLNDVTATGNGFFVNGGYEWRWDSGLGILLGGGIGHLSNVHATNGVTTIDTGSFTHFNIEAGLRFMFL